jgi:DNA-directed RNA polymerase sigma subunit (sigma70/sigma32)
MTKYWRLEKIMGLGNLTDRSLEIVEALGVDPRPTYSQLAKRFGVTKQRVGQIALRAGVEYGGSGRRAVKEVSDDHPG